MKNMRKFWALLLCLALSFSLLPAVAFASGVLTRSEAKERLYNDLMTRTETDSFSFYLTNGADDPIGELDELLYEAMEHQGVTNPVAGDYLVYQSTCDPREYTLVKGSTTYYLEVSIDFSYTMPDADEDNAAFQVAYDALNLSSIDDVQEKVKTIYKFLREKVNYSPVSDYDTEYTEYIKDTAYGALNNHEADTLGFALAFYRIALTAGIDARVVSGHNPDGKETYWNLVQIGDNWYILNAASGYSDYLAGLNDYAGYRWDDDDLKTEYTISETRYGASMGDVNGDKAVNLQDLLALKNYLAGTEGLVINERGADMNDDTYVNLKDLLLLKQYLANN